MYEGTYKQHTFMHGAKPQPSAYNQENDFCLTTRSDLIWKPLETNLCLDG